MLGVPVLVDEDLIGVVVVVGREPQSFTDEHIALVQTFADQAAIAITNARLCDARHAPSPGHHWVYVISYKPWKISHIGKADRLSTRWHPYFRQMLAGSYCNLWWANDLLHEEPNRFHKIRWAALGPFETDPTDPKRDERRIRSEFWRERWQVSSMN